MKKSVPGFLLAVVLVFLPLGGLVAQNPPGRGVPASEDTEGIAVLDTIFSSKNWSIKATIYIPDDGPQRKPLLVYSHGLGQKGQESKRICIKAARCGYVAVNFDFRGGGKESLSDGDIYDMSAKTELKDLGRVIKRMRRERYIDKKRIYLIGHSLGAWVSHLYGVSRPSRIKGMILLAPGYNLPDTAHELYPDQKSIPEQGDLLGFPVGRAFFADIYDTDPYGKAHRFKGRVLIIHGEEDDIVPIAYSEKASSLLTDSHLEPYPSVGHTFGGEIGIKMREDVGNYLLEEKAKP